MTAVGEILDRLGADLNDARHVTWPRGQLRDFIAEAVRVLFGYRPQAFVREADIPVRACRAYNPVDPCTTLPHDGVLGESDGLGHVLRPLRPCSDDAAMRWPGGPCPPGRPYRMRDYSISGDGTGLRVYPEPPPGTTAWVAVRCPVRPSSFPDDLDLDDELLPAVVQWCLFQAKMMDSENNAAVLAAAQGHEEEFWKLAGAKAPSRKERRGADRS
jgi:hypothetical protein